MSRTIERFMLIILALALLLALFLTSQVRWTTDYKDGVPLEEVIMVDRRETSQDSQDCCSEE
ncbi:hypothetical protein [Natronospora cellulosivora (SeqCode)]